MNIADIRALKPCYDPAKYLPESWQGTARDILSIADCPAEDRLWVVLRSDWIPAPVLRTFALWCAREALKLLPAPNQRSVAAYSVARRYVKGTASAAELIAAQAEAQNAANAAACAATTYAKRAAAAAYETVAAAVEAADAQDAPRAKDPLCVTLHVRDAATAAARAATYVAVGALIAKDIETGDAKSAAAYGESSAAAEAAANAAREGQVATLLTLL
jgi:hypothetical protein